MTNFTPKQREQLDAMARKLRERREQATGKPLQPHRDNDYPDLDVPACDPRGLTWRPDR